MNSCPICSNLILRHVRQKEIYWYCSHCHQEVPNFTLMLKTMELRSNKKSLYFRDKITNK